MNLLSLIFLQDINSCRSFTYHSCLFPVSLLWLLVFLDREMCACVHMYTHTIGEISLKDKKSQYFQIDDPFILVIAQRFLSSGHEAVIII